MFTFFLVVVNGWQLILIKVGEKNTLAALEASHNQADASIKAANAAEENVRTIQASAEKHIAAMHAALAAAQKANEISENALIVSNRPWVGVRNVEVVSLEAGKHFQAKVRVINSGRGPALQMRGGVMGRIFSKLTPGPFVPTIPDGSTERSVLMPAGEFFYDPFSAFPTLTEDQIHSIESGEMVVWIAGRIEYLDALGKTHHTSIRSVYRPSTNSFGATAEGNEAD